MLYQYRMFPTKTQLKRFLEQLEVHKNLYNNCLEKKINEYKAGNKISCFDLIKSEVPKFKGKVNANSLQQTIRRLDKSYKAFFRKNSSFPRFKNRFRTIAYAKIGNGCKIKDGKTYLQHIGYIKTKFHRVLPSNIKTLSVTFKNGTMYLNVFFEESRTVEARTYKNVGIDFGISTTLVTSDGDKFSTPKFTKKQSRSLARLQRKKEKAKNKRKVRKAIAKLYTKIANRRTDFNHKLSRNIVNKYDIICLEDLKVSELMSKVSNINSRINDIGISQLKNYIKYKAENAGKIVVLVCPAYTTQTCSKCLKIKEKKITDREHVCECGLATCRDINAANNILRLGLQSLGISP